jgi:hypothetical protein
MLDEPILRAKARGNGARCAICELPVTEEELKFEIHFDGNSVEPGRDMFHVHAPCFEAWECPCPGGRSQHESPHPSPIASRAVELSPWAGPIVRSRPPDREQDDAEGGHRRSNVDAGPGAHDFGPRRGCPGW